MNLTALERSKRAFLAVVFCTALLKMWLAYCFPITSDEAFFLLWAQFPNWGYYDHPPMIGWWLWVFNQLGSSPWWIRSATVVLTTLVAWVLVQVGCLVLPDHQQDRAWWAGAVYLSMPISWVSVFVTTDTPLIFFVTFSVWMYLKAQQRGSAWYMLWAGVFLGLAFLSKYFAVLLGVAYVVDTVWKRRSLRLLCVLVLGCAPFVLENLVYNAYNCWNNIMFNLVNRHDDAHLGWKNTALFIIMMIYLITPWGCWRLFKAHSAWRQHAVLVSVAFVPLLVFFLLSLEKTIGLHWVLGFLPWVFVLLAVGASADDLKRYVRWNALLSVPHVFALGVLLHGTITIWPSVSFQQDIQFHRQGADIVKQLTQDLPPDGVLSTLAYSPASLMSVHLGRIVPVFGPGKYHARNDDVFVDWRAMDGKFIRIVNKAKPIDPALYQPYFDHVTVRTETVEGIPFSIVDGEHFHFQTFRDLVLKEAVEKYYRIPSWLPVLDCPFARKYGFEALCRL